MPMPVYRTMYPFNAFSPKQEYPKIIWQFLSEDDQLSVKAYLFKDHNTPDPVDEPIVHFSMPEVPDTGYLEQTLSVIKYVELREYEILLEQVNEIWNRIYQNHQKRVMQQVHCGFTAKD